VNVLVEANLHRGVAFAQKQADLAEQVVVDDRAADDAHLLWRLAFIVLGWAGEGKSGVSD
jgi:hypothetical protein